MKPRAYDVTITSGTQSWKNMTTIRNIDSSDLMMIIRREVNISARSPKLEWVTLTNTILHIANKIKNDCKDMCQLSAHTAHTIVKNIGKYRLYFRQSIYTTYDKLYRHLLTPLNLSLHICDSSEQSCIIMMIMMTSSNGNIFRVTGHLCGEFTGLRGIPSTKASDAELWCFFYMRPNKQLSKQSWGWWFETPLWSLWRHRNVAGTYGVISHWANTTWWPLQRISLAHTTSCTVWREIKTWALIQYKDVILPVW